MRYVKRMIETSIERALARGKSILFLGPRQVGKTTLIEERFAPDISYTFAKAKARVRYEKDLMLFEGELEKKIENFSKKPLVFIDEVQKIPQVMDVVQVLIDEDLAQFILTGSSARKLKHGCQLNLLPGRVVSLTLAPLVYEEMKEVDPTLEELLLFGSLPEIITRKNWEDREVDLSSYVVTYLEEEIRAEAAVRNVAHFSRFLEIAAGECGKPINFSRISQDIGVAHSTISEYYQILEDSLIAHRIDPITNGKTKRRLMKSPRYLFFDLGVRRVCANEGVRLPVSAMRDAFEQYVGLELIRYAHLTSAQIKVRYWKDLGGPEVDFVLEMAKHYVPIEVKWNDAPQLKDARHLIKFLAEYPEAEKGYIVSRTPHPYCLRDDIEVISWKELYALFQSN